MGENLPRSYRDTSWSLPVAASIWRVGEITGILSQPARTETTEGVQLRDDQLGRQSPRAMDYSEPAKRPVAIAICFVMFC